MNDAESLNDLTERCRTAGLRVTPQRLEVLRCLRASREHPSPEVLHKSVLRSMPTLSLATVYKTLDTLEALGLAQRVPTVGGALRFDGRTDTHQHLVCTDCGRIADVDDERLMPVAQAAFGEGFLGDRIHVQVLGRCARCREMEEKRRDSPGFPGR